MNKDTGQTGNVLIIILVAVALFAALTYVVSQSARSGAGNIEQEKFGILVSQLTQYPVNVRSGVMRITVMDGAGSENVSFDWPAWGHTRYQHPVPRPDTQKVFHPDGAGVPFQKPDTEKMLERTESAAPFWGTWIFTGTSCVPGIGTGNDASCAADITMLDLVAFLPYVKRELCVQVNRSMKINEAGDGMPPVLIGDAWGAIPEFDGTYEPGAAIIDAGNLLYGRDAGCFEGNGTPPAGTYHFYMTLVHR